MTGVALPNFWLGLMLIVVFGVWLGWLPIYGYVSILDSPSEWALRMVMPVVTLGTALSATLMRQTRSAMLEVLEEDYIRTARSKGLNERSVIGLHALKNALLPVVTVSSLQLGQLIGGTLITESVFALPGVGKFILDAIIEQDYQVFQMGMLVIVLGVVLANFMADILYAYLDPRIRYE
jgi:peptide/nickel transport system permease protein